MGLNNPSSVEVEGMVQVDGKGRIFFWQGHVVNKLEFFQKLPQVEVYYIAFHSENSFDLNADTIGDLNS